MIYKAGKLVFHEHYVSFHFHRENPYCPWRVIGIYVCYNKKAKCRYAEGFDHIKEHFLKEAELAGNQCDTYDFLDKWRNLHVEVNSGMTRVIKYCSVANSAIGVLTDLAKIYLGTDSAIKLNAIAVMVKSHKRYFPIVFSSRKDYGPVLDELKKAQLI